MDPNTPNGLRSAVALDDHSRLLRHMKDYSRVGMNLIWQREMIFAAALGLAAFYYSGAFAFSILCLIVISEGYDYLTFRAILNYRGNDPKRIKRFLTHLCLGTIISASTIATYSLGIALLEGPATHFMPLFFLFAAALFAAMNNHQMLPLLLIRLLIYGCTFIFIPVWDIWQTSAPIQSALWNQLFTSLFVLYFIIDCSRIYMNFYRTKMRHMEALREEHEKTKQAYRAKSEFLSTMSHELRTPMTSIKGSVDLALSGKLGEMSPKVENVLRIAQRNGVRLSTLINEILELQKIESGKMTLEPELFELTDFVRQSVETYEPYAESFHVSLELDLPRGPIYVRADRSRLEQVLANLLSNASKFSFEGGQVTVRLVQIAGRARLEVIDQGIGLDEAHRDKVFDRFSQLDGSDERKIGGTGLGMNISRRIMQMHGGRIDYTRNTGPGTTFFIELATTSPTEAADDSTLAVTPNFAMAGE